MNELEHSAGLAPTPGYRYADVVGDQLFVAGQVPLDETGTLIAPNDVGAQTTACLDNLRRVLEPHDFVEHDVRHLTIHVVGNQQSLSTARHQVRSWFADDVPPATLLGASLLGYVGQVVEVDAVVVRRH
jgi:enamine deaminase RidA (YjgF/YER057c/UK114 family)